MRVMREVFAGIDARTSLPGVLRAVADYRPDVILREPTEYAGLLAAERLGVAARPDRRSWPTRRRPGACRSSRPCSTATASGSACVPTRAASGSTRAPT